MVMKNTGVVLSLFVMLLLSAQASHAQTCPAGFDCGACVTLDAGLDDAGVASALEMAWNITGFGCVVTEQKKLTVTANGNECSGTTAVSVNGESGGTTLCQGFSCSGATLVRFASCNGAAFVAFDQNTFTCDDVTLIGPLPMLSALGTWAGGILGGLLLLSMAWFIRRRPRTRAG